MTNFEFIAGLKCRNEIREKLEKVSEEYWLVNFKTDAVFPAKTICCGLMSKEEVEEVKRKTLLNQCVLQAYERTVSKEVYQLYQELKELQEKKNVLLITDPAFEETTRMIDKKYHMIEELVRQTDKECEPVILISA